MSTLTTLGNHLECVIWCGVTFSTALPLQSLSKARYFLDEMLFSSRIVLHSLVKAFVNLSRQDRHPRSFWLLSLISISYHKVELIWVPRYEEQQKARWMCCTLIVFGRSHAMKWLLRQITFIFRFGEIASRWSVIDTCRTSKTLWSLRSRKKTQTSLSFDMISIRLLSLYDRTHV